MDYGVLTLVPILIVILIALTTKRTLEALMVGTLSTYIITDGFGFLHAWIEAFFSVATSRDNQWIFMVCALFGNLITLIGASRGTAGFSRHLEKICRGPRTTLLSTWVLGILIFVDDYLNIMTLSSCMRKLTDKFGQPRETLSYIIDSTGAPVCAILPFSTWAVFFAGLFFSQPAVEALGYGSGLQTFYHVIPYAFYAIAAVFLIPLFIFGIVPRMGLMKAAYARVASTGMTYSPASEKLNLEDENDAPDLSRSASLLDFAIPIGMLIALAVITGDLFLAIVAANITCFLLYVPRGKIGFSRFCDLAMHGFCNMVPTIAVIYFAFVMQRSMQDIGIANYVINAVCPYMNGTIFPVATFLIVAVLNFSTGSVWGIPAMVVPILIPLAASIDANMLLVMGAIVSGATLGSHACFYSDATVLTSSCCKMQNMDHALSQMPYALLAAAVSAAGYLVCGLAM